MDDVLGALKTFERELDEFTNAMAEASKSLEAEHNKVSALWKDSFARQYSSRWNSFEQHMRRYIRTDAPRYHSFLQQKIRQVSQYLGHG